MEAQSSTSPGPSPRRPLGKGAILLVAGVLLAAVAGAFVFFRGSLNKMMSPTAESVGAKKPCLVVVPFRPSGGSQELAWIGDAVQVFLSLSLENILELKVLTPERVFDLSKPSGLASREAEMEMAEKGGADYLLLGEVSGAPASVQMKASLVEIKSGEERGQWIVDGISENSLGRKLDELAAQVRKALGLQGTDTQGPPLASLVPLKEAPTRSYVAGALLLAKGEPASTLDELKVALQLEDFPLARFLEALAAAQRGDPPRAVQAAVPLSKLSRPMPARVTLMVPVILALYQSGNPRNAVAPLESFLARFPDEKNPLSWLGAIELFLLNEPSRAAKDFKRALALDPSSPDNERLLAQATLESGHPAEAATLLKKYLTLRPEDDTSRLLLVRAQRDAGETRDAMATVEQVLVRQPANVSAIALKGALLLDQGNFREAAALYQTLVASPQPRLRAEGMALSAQVSLLTGHFGDGLRSLRDAVNLGREAGLASLQGQYLMSLAQALSNLGEYQEALSTLSAVREVESNLDADLPVISVMVRQKQYDAARGMLEAQVPRWQGKLSARSIEKLRSSVEGNIALEQGKYADAVSLLQAALPEDPLRAPASEALGRALLASGDAPQAAEIFRRIVEDPNRFADPVGYVRNLERLGEAYEKSGKKQDAIRTYREVLQWWGSSDFPRPEAEEARQALKRLGG
jgi:tetratricopeptide (TPR) repeat protein